MTTLNSPILTAPQQRGGRVDDFVDRLSHPATVQTSGPLATAFQAIISFGLLPLLLWPSRWAEFLDSERQDLLDLIGWWRRRVAPADAAQLDQIAKKLRPRPMLVVLPWLAVGFNIVLMAMLLSQGDSLNRLWQLTFQHAAQSSDTTWVVDHWVPSVPLEGPFYPAWIVTLCLAYGCQWYAVRSHARRVRSLVQWTNNVGRENRFMRISNEVTRGGIHPLWIILAIAFCSQHAWWAIPMVGAGAFQRRYSMRTSPAVRVALAGQARDAFAIVQTSGERFCAAGHCGARLPSPAKFCPRCGTAV